MLYDKRWDKPEVKADPFSLESLIAWLEKQSGKYEFCDSTLCALGQWVGGKNAENGNSYQYDVEGRTVDLNNYRDIVAFRPHTFGAALSRARKALAERG